MGKPEEIMEDLTTSINTPNKVRPEKDKDKTLPAAETTNESFNIEPMNSTTASNSKDTAVSTPNLEHAGTASQEKCPCEVCTLIGTKPTAIPGKKWVPMWTIQNSTGNKSFEELVLDKIKGPQVKKKTTRRKVDLTAKVTTESTYVEKLKELEAKPKKTTKKKTQKKIDFEQVAEGPQERIQGVIEEVSEESETEEDDSDDDDESDKEMLVKLWGGIINKDESDVVNRWYGAIYETQGKRKEQQTLFVGKALHHFKEFIELDCLVPPANIPTVPVLLGQSRFLVFCPRVLIYAKLSRFLEFPIKLV